jgi:ABC-type transport system substrate-binding protein
MTGLRKTRTGIGLGLVLALACAVAVSLGAGGAGAAQQALPRAQTFYMSGNQWSPNNDLNPAKNWDYITGLVGFAYETPFRYDPLKDTFRPWLATGGKWTSKSVYTMAVRKGVKWSDGQPMTAKDVAYSFNLLKLPTHPQHPLFADTGLKSVKAVGSNVVFTFAGTPAYQEFDFYRFNVAVVPQHVFKGYSATDITTGNLEKGKIVGTGPYVLQSGVGATSNSVVWKKNPGWWAGSALGLKVGPQYVVDIKNGTNAAALSNLLAGNIDLFNNFAPKTAIKGKFKTYFSKAPYHLGANTTWLFPNTTKKPLDDAAFRKALANSINMGQIIDKAYQGLVNKASPTGLLPIWNKWIDKKVVAKNGFSYNPTKAKALLAAAGYKDTNGDGFVENKDGSKIGLDDRDPGHLRERQAGRHQDHAELSRVRDADRRSRARAVRPAARQRPADVEHAVDVLPVHLQPADRRQPDDDELPAVHRPEGVQPDAAAEPHAVDQHEGIPDDPVGSAEALPADAAGDPPLVQRHVVDGQHPVLDGLAVRDAEPVHAELLAELLADDEHRHAHPSPADEGGVGRRMPNG